MTDPDIDKALALAIGWRQDQMYTLDGKMLFLPFDKHWKSFSHKDPGVIWPIAECYCCFPSHIDNGDFKAAKAAGHSIASRYECLRFNYSKHCWEKYEADSPATAVALAVIGKAKK